MRRVCFSFCILVILHQISQAVRCPTDRLMLAMFPATIGVDRYAERIRCLLIGSVSLPLCQGFGPVVCFFHGYVSLQAVCLWLVNCILPI